MRWRNVLLKLHLFLGLFAGLVLVVVSLTGAILVFEPELDEALHPHLWRVEPRTAPWSVDSILHAARTAYPGQAFVTLEIPADPGHSCMLTTEGVMQVFVDPHTGRILGSRDYRRTLFGWFFSLHRTLLAGELGRRIVGIATLLALILIVTGLCLWWPRTHARLSSSFTIKWGAGWKRLLYDMHSVLGFYASWFLMIIAMTGLVWSFALVQQAIFWITDSPPPPWKARPASMILTEKPAIALDEAVRQAEAAIPGTMPTEILLPQKPEDTIQLVRRDSRSFNPNAQSFVAVDQYSGKILQLARYEDLPLGSTIRLLVYPIHVGSIFGLPSRMLALAVSTFLAVSTLTGFLMWWTKRTVSLRWLTHRH